MMTSPQKRVDEVRRGTTNFSFNWGSGPRCFSRPSARGVSVATYIVVRLMAASASPSTFFESADHRSAAEQPHTSPASLLRRVGNRLQLLARVKDTDVVWESALRLARPVPFSNRPASLRVGPVRFESDWSERP